MKERRRFLYLAGVLVVLMLVYTAMVLVADFTKTRLIQRKEDEIRAYYTALYFTGTGEGSAIALDNNVGYVTFNLMNFIDEDVTERDIVYEIKEPTVYYNNKNAVLDEADLSSSIQDNANGITDEIHVRDVWGQPRKVGRETYKYEFDVMTNSGEKYTGEQIAGESLIAENYLFKYEKLEGSGSSHAVGKTHTITLKVTRDEEYPAIVGTEKITVVVQLLKPYKEVYLINMTISERLIVFSSASKLEFENKIEELHIQTADIYSHIYTKDSNGDYVSKPRTINGKTISSLPLQVTLTWDNLIFNEVLTNYFPEGVVITDLTTLSSDSGSVTLLIPQSSDFKLQFVPTDATYTVNAKVEIYDNSDGVNNYVLYDSLFGGYTNTEITIKSDDSLTNPDCILVLNETKTGLVH